MKDVERIDELGRIEKTMTMSPSDAYFEALADWS